ncbi:MAG TPA: hypothetical protein PLP17_01375 [Oligoflexia bacterium]|nr:hypothetical protein [Oligoflexia bacterium]
MMFAEIKRIESIGAAAWEFVLDGEFRKARRLLKKIRNSPYVCEAERAAAVVEAKILQRSAKQKEAKERIMQSIGYLWNCGEALEICAASNPAVNEDSKVYHLEVLGGIARLGVFTCFPANYISSFDVAANSIDEAFAYISELANFAEPDTAEIIECSEYDVSAAEFAHRGVIAAYPFRPHDDAEQQDETERSALRH